MSPVFLIFLVGIAVSLSAVPTVEAENPGLILQFSKKLFNYDQAQITVLSIASFNNHLMAPSGINLAGKSASYQGMLRARTLLLKTRLQDRSGKEGFMKYSLTGLRFISFKAKSASVEFPENKGLGYKMDGIEIKVAGNIQTKFEKCMFEVYASQISVRLSIALVFNATTRKLSAKPMSCQSFVPIPKVKVLGCDPEITEMFSSILDQNIMHEIESKVCGKCLAKYIKKSLGDQLSKLPTRLPFMKKFLLDITMLKAPLIKGNVLKTQLKGEVFWMNKYKECPKPVLPMEPLPSSTASSMVTIQVSSYLLNTISYVAYKNNYINFVINTKNFPKPGFLSTTCKGKMCIGNLIPQIGKTYPNKQVSILVQSSEPPKLNITSGYLYADLPHSVIFYLSTDTTKKPLLILPVNIHTVADAKIGNGTFHFKLKTLNVVLGMLKKNTKIKFDVKKFQKYLNVFISGVALPQINKKGRAGMLLPQPTKMVRLTNTSFKFGLNSAMLMTDMAYTGNPLVTKMHPLTMLLNTLGSPECGIVKALASIDMSGGSGKF